MYKHIIMILIMVLITAAGCSSGNINNGNINNGSINNEKDVSSSSSSNSSNSSEYNRDDSEKQKNNQSESEKLYYYEIGTSNFDNDSSLSMEEIKLKDVYKSDTMLIDSQISDNGEVKQPLRLVNGTTGEVVDYSEDGGNESESSEEPEGEDESGKEVEDSVEEPTESEDKVEESEDKVEESEDKVEESEDTAALSAEAKKKFNMEKEAYSIHNEVLNDIYQNGIILLDNIKSEEQFNSCHKVTLQIVVTNLSKQLERLEIITCKVNNTFTDNSKLKQSWNKLCTHLTAYKEKIDSMRSYKDVVGNTELKSDDCSDLIYEFIRNLEVEIGEYTPDKQLETYIGGDDV